jgi:hypothetical protein
MLAAAVLLAQYAGTLEFLDTTRASTRATQPRPQLTSPPREIALALDLSTSPSARLRMAERRWDWTLTYSPVLTASDVELGEESNQLLLHAGVATFAWRDRFVTVALSEAGAYGTRNSALLYQLPAAPGQTTPLQSAPAPTTIDFGSSNTDGNVAVRLGRPVVASLFGGYAVSGGLNTRSQGILPQQFGPRAGASVAITLSRSDTVTTLASAQDLTTSGPCPQAVAPAPPLPITAYCRERTFLAQAQETLRHQLSASATLSAGLGVAATRTTEQANGQDVLVIDPVGIVAFTQRLSQNRAANLTLSAQLSPFVDILTGIPSERAQLSAVLADPVSASVLVTFTANATKSAPVLTSDPRSDSFLLTALNGSIEARIRLDPRVDLAIGVQAFWQDQENFASFSSEIGYVSVTARAPTLHF